VRARLRDEWAALPRWARWVLALYIAGFAEGTADHVARLVLAGKTSLQTNIRQIDLALFLLHEKGVQQLLLRRKRAD
jgi:hypothetical protein